MLLYKFIAIAAIAFALGAVVTFKLQVHIAAREVYKNIALNERVLMTQINTCNATLRRAYTRMKELETENRRLKGEREAS